MFLKTNSYGEYVFDWSWARAYEQAGLNYYPKLISAIPFTPSAGERVFLSKNVARASLLKSIVAILNDEARENYAYAPADKDAQVLQNECLP